jgi:uridine kinase
MRDIQRCGQCAGDVIQQVSDTVYPMYKAFIERDLEKAEIKVVNNFNPFAGFKEPVQILKTSDPVSVQDAQDVLQRLFPNSEVLQVCTRFHRILNSPLLPCRACVAFLTDN